MKAVERRRREEKVVPDRKTFYRPGGAGLALFAVFDDDITILDFLIGRHVHVSFYRWTTLTSFYTLSKR